MFYSVTLGLFQTSLFYTHSVTIQIAGSDAITVSTRDGLYTCCVKQPSHKSSCAVFVIAVSLAFCLRIMLSVVGGSGRFVFLSGWFKLNI